eukprot:gene6330-11763_t
MFLIVVREAGRSLAPIRKLCFEIPWCSKKSKYAVKDNIRIVQLIKCVTAACRRSTKRKSLCEDGEENDEFPERCKECLQFLNNSEIQMFIGDVENAVEELCALCDPKLSLFSGEDVGYEEKPQHKITNFSVYDKNTHLCPFDTGLIEKNKELMMSGFLKPIYDEDPSPEGGIAVKNIGPINEWWITGFDGGERALIGFTTAFAEYILVKPSDEYAPFVNAVLEKIYMSKAVIEFLNIDPEVRYEDLLNKIQTTVPPENCPRFTEDTLLRHSQFLVEQIESYDSAAEPDERLLITSPCVRDLIKLAGVTLGKRRQLRGMRIKAEAPKKKAPTKATTTPLVRYIFDMFFKDQIESKGNEGPRKKRCGVCDVCQQPDCGECKCCKDMKKFGGSGKSKQCCINRRCPYMEVKNADEEDEELDNPTVPVLGSPKHKNVKSKTIQTKVKWIGNPVETINDNTYYSAVSINGETVNVGDFVKVCSDDESAPLFICRVAYMWQDQRGQRVFHSHRATETVLGETGDVAEVFFSDECDDNPLGSILSRCDVEIRKLSSEWFLQGAAEELIPEAETEDDESHSYDCDKGKFTDIPDVFTSKQPTYQSCPCCTRKNTALKEKTPELTNVIEQADDKTVYKSVLFKNEEYLPGNFVFCMPEAFTFKVQQKPKERGKRKENYDEEMYPEYYRKGSDHIKGSNLDVPSPFRIGQVLSVYKRKGVFGDSLEEIFLRLRKFYRPEDTHKGLTGTGHSDLNLLYWTSEEVEVNFALVRGKCSVICGEDLPVDQIKNDVPCQFYYLEAYNGDTRQFEDLPSIARAALNNGKSKGKGKGKGKSKAKLSHPVDQPLNKPEEDVMEASRNKFQKLRSLDVFAGCGGLTQGFHQSGIAETHWAIEKEESAAQAFKLNYPNASVFTDDCNLLLKMVMEGKEHDSKGQKLPRKGDVQLLCGGPPCQGFSGMNRFNSRDYSQFKNSLVASYLSYCDFYRPRFFVLENCSFGILQAGSYGVPQTRRRAIIIAAAPGEVLPCHPEVKHVFSSHACQLSVCIDNKRYQAVPFTESAPYRTITVRDALSDLPEIRNGANRPEMAYTEPQSHFQRKMRAHEDQMLRDHICKEMSALTAARMRHIPTEPGSDWRDLPNVVERLPDGAHSTVLRYTHHDKKNGRTSQGKLRGVCSCAEGKECDPGDRQFNTLIPWCLPHTGNRHNNWAGLYGRLEWGGFFSTTITNPEPMGKQGRVLHPEQHRVVSVRECARSQGFPDSFRFFGSILDKHRQVGNAVPPPMAFWIAEEIKKCIAAKDKMTEEQPAEQ